MALSTMARNDKTLAGARVLTLFGSGCQKLSKSGRQDLKVPVAALGKHWF
jgi:hypothetical protein